jgi:hypothetical protein
LRRPKAGLVYNKTANSNCYLLQLSLLVILPVMFPHPVFSSLYLHTGEELEALLQSPVVARTTLHEWPLSCVQLLQLGDGRRLVYKTQLPPTVEPAFYAQATSALLTGHRSLGLLENCSVMLLDWIEAPLLSTVTARAEVLVTHARQLTNQIGCITGNLPVYLDIGSVASWHTVAEHTFAQLEKLMQAGIFHFRTANIAGRLAQWSRSPAVLQTIAEGCRVIHGDLKADQVFLPPGSYRVIDWQRPVIAPPATDLVTLLLSLGIDPRPYADAAVIQLAWFLRLYWAVEAQCNLFPGFRGTLFKQWAAEAIRGILVNRQSQ